MTTAGTIITESYRAIATTLTLLLTVSEMQTVHTNSVDTTTANGFGFQTVLPFSLTVVSLPLFGYFNTKGIAWMAMVIELTVVSEALLTKMETVVDSTLGLVTVPETILSGYRLKTEAIAGMTILEYTQ